MHSEAERSLRVSATLGAAAWAALAVLARAQRAPMGAIELLFLFAPLVVIPLGLVLGEHVAPGNAAWIKKSAGTLQPMAAALAVAGFWLPPGIKAAALAAPWAAFCALIALQGLLSLTRDARPTLATVAINVGRLDLAVAAVWLLISRLGIRLMGVQEPIALLTAVHFHYTGFATALLAGTALEFVQHRAKAAGIVVWIVRLVVFVPFLIAAGFVFSPILKVTGVVLLSLSVTGLAVTMLWSSKAMQCGTARWFIRLSSSAAVAGMALAVIYGIGDLLGRDWLLIPRMASTHGVLNSMGFVLLGLLGWLAEGRIER